MDKSTKKKMPLWQLLAIGFGIILILSIFIKQPSDPQEPLFELNKVCGRRVQEVEKVLGVGIIQFAPVDYRPGDPPNIKYIYQNGKFEVSYMSGIAHIIRVNDLSNYSFTDRSVTNLLGLKLIPAESKNDLVKRWYDLKNCVQIAAYNKAGKIDYILVQCKHKARQSESFFDNHLYGNQF